MAKSLKRLIKEGENVHLDFKFCISDSKKIARTLSAFANTQGGRLLIGVRDNGSIAGIRTDEEFYMIDTASKIYCKPEIPVEIKQHIIEGKTILEIVVEQGSKKPYRAKNEDGRWIAYYRHHDQNLVANNILMQIWRKEERPSGILIRFGKAENVLMEYLKNNESITFSGFKKIARIPPYRAEKILVNLLICNVLEMEASEKGYRYRINTATQPWDSE